MLKTSKTNYEVVVHHFRNILFSSYSKSTHGSYVADKDWFAIICEKNWKAA